MTLPVSGEQHDKAMRALLGAAPDYGSEFCECGPQATPWIECPAHWALAVLERLARQGVVLVEHLRCGACAGHGKFWYESRGEQGPGPRCNPTGRARMVDVNEIVAMLRDPPRFSIYSPSRAEWFRAADFIERRFASEDTAKEER